jgi:glycine betaine/proline transport system ATP-binding protein
MPEAKISIRNLYKIFGPKPIEALKLVEAGVSKQVLLNEHGHILALSGINLEIRPKYIQVVMGLSGSGKSTLIRHINRLIEPTLGEITADGLNVLKLSKMDLRAFRKKKVSMVFQKFALFPHRTVADNVAYGLRIQNISDTEVKRRSRKWIERVGLSGFENRYPSQLSGGMQQRVGLARALAVDTDIVLMDEAFSALDPLIRTEMQSILLDLQKEFYKTIVFITHDLDEALKIGDNIAILRDGVVVQTGIPSEIILQPSDNYVAEFTKEINRARMLRVGAIAGNKVPANGPRIESDVSLEVALQMLSHAQADSGVVVQDGKPVGGVSINAMIEAIARPKLNGLSRTCL